MNKILKQLIGEALITMPLKISLEQMNHSQSATTGKMYGKRLYRAETLTNTYSLSYLPSWSPCIQSSGTGHRLGDKSQIRPK